jgi:tRNA modification GTPase
MDTSTIAAIATPGGRGGIGIVKISGPRAVSIASRLFCPVNIKPESQSRKTQFSLDALDGGLQSHRLNYGYMIDPNNGRVIDEVLMSIMKSPRSYTKEDVVEINAHGGRVAVNAILEAVLQGGARLAEPGEFTKRAFLNGRIDLTQAEAVIDVINARTDKSLQVAAAQIDGKLKRSVEVIREFLVEFLTCTEAAIDFPEEGVEIMDTTTATVEIKTKALKPLQSLIQHYQDGNVLRDGLKVAVVGRPNVGKSSLMNCLVQKERAIVTTMPGTTRDAIEETLNIEGIPVIITDTAGLHETVDPIESIGIAKTIENLNGSDLVLFMVEANVQPTAEDDQIFKRVQQKPFIIVINKNDLVNCGGPVEFPDSWTTKNCVRISALYNQGIDRLKEKMIKSLLGEKPIDINDAIVPNLRQKLLLEESLNAAEGVCRTLNEGHAMELTAIHLQDAIEALDQILGKSVRVDVLDQIFSRFCIGK